MSQPDQSLPLQTVNLAATTATQSVRFLKTLASWAAFRTGVLAQAAVNPILLPHLEPCTTVKTIVYNEHAQRLTLYTPDEQNTKTEAPLIVFVHGGAWTLGLGSRHDFESYGLYLARHGLASASIGYRLSPQYAYPSGYEDVNDALDWLAENHPCEKVILIGHSAGAHLSLLTALRRQSQQIIGVVSLAGPTDLTQPDACRFCGSSKQLFLRATTAEEASPISYVQPQVEDAKMPKVFLYHGVNDAVVDISQSQQLALALNEAGYACILKELDREDHYFPFLSATSITLNHAIMDNILVNTADELGYPNILEPMTKENIAVENIPI